MHTVQQLSGNMRKIDVAVLSTKGPGGAICSRPMSNNGDVDFDGTSYFFTNGDTQKIRDIEADERVSLSFTGKPGANSKSHFFVTVHGRAELICDRQVFNDHWTSDLDNWFDQGPETPGLVMIKVRAERIRYWDGADQGELIVT